MRNNSPPQAALKRVPEDDARQIVAPLVQLHAMGAPPKTDQELRDRIQLYFQKVAQSGAWPGIESLCSAVGISRSTFYAWQQGRGCSEQRQEICKAAKTLINAALEQGMLSGRISPVAGIFLLKCWSGYRDGKSFDTETPEDTGKPVMTLEQIRERVLQDIPQDDDEST